MLDRAAVAAATMCDARPCPACTCPHDELDRTDVVYPYRHSDEVKARVDAARRELLHDQGRVKDRHLTKVGLYIRYRIRYPTRYRVRYVCYYSIYDVVYDIAQDILYDMNTSFSRSGASSTSQLLKMLA